MVVFLLGELTIGRTETRIVSYLEVLVGVVTCHKDTVDVGVLEGDLGADHVSSRVLQELVGDVLLPVNLPQEDGLLWLVGQRGEKLFVFRAESHRDELFGLGLGRGDDLVALESVHVVNHADG